MGPYWESRLMLSLRHSYLFLLMLSILAVSTPAFSTTLSFDQCSSCGNPGNALRVIVGDVNPGSEAAIGFVNNTFGWDPGTRGPIHSIGASVDKNITVSQSTPFTASFASNFRPLIEQDGNFYLAQILGPIVPATNTTSVTSGYSTISISKPPGLLASDFVLFDFGTGTLGSTHPDFAGHAMLFGLASITGPISLGSQLRNASLESDFDNLVLNVDDLFIDTTFNLINYSETREFIAPVPEPATILLLGCGLIGLAGYGRKKFFKK